MTTGRSCGSCTLCCKVLEIPEMNKPRGQWCPKCDRTGGTAGAGGCTIYQARPQPCQAFQCLWVLGLGSEELKPEYSHVVLQPAFSQNRIDAYCDPEHPEAFRRTDVYQGLMNLSTRYTVVVVLADHGLLLKDGAEKAVTVTV